MIKIKITVLSEKGKKAILNVPDPKRGEKIIGKLAGISAEQTSDTELVVTIKHLNISMYAVMEDNYRKVFDKRDLEENKDYKIEIAQ